MIVEIFQMPNARQGTAGVYMERWPAMRRQGYTPRLTQSPNAQKPGDPSTARGIGLQDVHGACRQHAAEIDQVIAILACRDVHAGWRLIAQKTQTLQIVRRDRFLEPVHVIDTKR